jgi:hypothetical protein
MKQVTVVAVRPANVLSICMIKIALRRVACETYGLLTSVHVGKTENREASRLQEAAGHWGT